MHTVFLNRRNILIGLGMLVGLGFFAYVCWGFTQPGKLGNIMEPRQRALAGSIDSVHNSIPSTLPNSNEQNQEIIEDRTQNNQFSASNAEIEPTNTDLQAIPATAVGAQARADSSQFFAEFRIERDRVRSQQVELYREIIANPETQADVRKEAQEHLFRLSQEIDQEMKSENLLAARGFPDSVICKQTDSVTVVVRSSTFSPEQQNSVLGLISRTVDCAEEKISIIVRS